MSFEDESADCAYRFAGVKGRKPMSCWSWRTARAAAPHRSRSRDAIVRCDDHRAMRCFINALQTLRVIQTQMERRWYERALG
jgi:hypothetical protein